MELHYDEYQGQLRRGEVLASGATIAAVFVLFLIAFFGRDYYGDGIRGLLIVLSSASGGAAAAGGLLSLYRAYRFRLSRPARFALGGLQLFVGVYTIIHVLF